MKKRTLKSKILSGILAFSLLVGTVPLSSFAESAAPTDSETITALTAPELAEQEITVGSTDAPTLPPTELSATLTKITWEEVPLEVPGGAPPQTEWQSSTTTENVSVTVAWTLPEGETFSAAEAKTFTYTAKLTGDAYTVSPDVVMPTFTVHVVAAQDTPQAAPPANTPPAPTKTISAFAEPDVIELSIGDTRTEADIIGSFPDSVSATVDGEENTDVPVTAWARVSPTGDTAFSTATSGEYFYAPTLAEGYTRADTARLPNLLVNVGEVMHAPQSLSDTGTESFRFTIETTAVNETFYIPLSSALGPELNFRDNYGKAYNWNIDWDSDGTIDETISTATTGAPQNAAESDGIPHTYAAAGTYEITITPAGTTDAWLAAFGFSVSATGAANQATNRAKITSINSALTPLMTRTQAQIEAGTFSHYEWANSFYGCTGLKSLGNTFTLPQSLTVVGFAFAREMFGGCTGLTHLGSFNLPQNLTSVDASFANSMFSFCTNLRDLGSLNLPQNLTAVEDGFAYYMFSNCTSLTGLGNLNLPQNLTAVGDDFASAMFSGCTGLSNLGNFNLPQNLTSVGDGFAHSMFFRCTSLPGLGNLNLPQNLTGVGDHFASTMFAECAGLTNLGNFNLPQNLETVGNYFALSMFSMCNNLSDLGNFNLPQNLTTVGPSFASSMFSDAGSAATPLVINDAFRFPKLTDEQLEQTSVFSEVFNGASLAASQSRTATSIINGNRAPTVQRDTFNGQNAAFIDYDFIGTNWGGPATPETPDYTIAYKADTISGTNVTYAPPAQPVASEQVLAAPIAPTAEGYTFENWYTDDSFTTLYDFTSAVRANTTLYARWNCNVVFETSGASAIAPQTVLQGETATEPATPTKAGMYFAGWYTDSSLTTLYNFNTPVNQNTTLYARWNRLPAITGGADQTITQGQSASFNSSGDFDGYVDTVVTLNNGTKQTVHTAGANNANASAVEGSIIVSLSGAYTATLPLGTHTISINSQGGSATANFTVVAATPTPTPTTPTATPTLTTTAPTPTNATTPLSPQTGVY